MDKHFITSYLQLDPFSRVLTFLSLSLETSRPLSGPKDTDTPHVIVCVADAAVWV